MSGTLSLAWQYVRYNKLKSSILILSIVLTALLPIAIKILLWQFNQKIVARADQTPAVIGPLGSDLDVALNATYFRPNEQANPLKFSEVGKVNASDLANAIPIHARFTAQKFQVVGTSFEYFSFRDLSLADGRFFATLGDCVLGSQVAQQLKLAVGDKILSDRKTVIGFGGTTPLKMKVVGILAASRSADDWAVFIDMKTAWVIEGLGHGHEDLGDEAEDSVKILKRTDKEIIASPGVVSFIEISDKNIGSFHFHGETSEFPVTSIIVVPNDLKSETLLEGRYGNENGEAQFTRPGIVLRDLMAMVFQINRFFDANAILIALSTALLLGLVVLLSLRLRAREMTTMFRMGCSRGTIVWLQVAELLIIFLAASILIAIAVWFIWLGSGSLVESLLTSQASGASKI